MHLAMRVAISALRTEKCCQIGSPYVGWQCRTCLALNEACVDVCEVCGFEEDTFSADIIDV